MEKIDISQYITDFKQVFEKESRMIFSAKFGDGKSYFLNEFIESFDSKKGDYYFITLHPVNYVVEDNKDIIEYIKRDILFQLIKDDRINDFKDKFDKVFDSVCNKESLLKLADFVASIFPVKGFKTGYDALTDLVTTIHNKFQDQDVLHVANDYLNGFYGKEGCISECDAFTCLIQETLKRMGKTVLIVEDLDRMDPAHLFRIMNVLSSQIDNPYYDDCPNKNKFGFDKIILVMDYDMTRHLFHHFYGMNANYDGYMNKFMNSTPFCFSITEAAQMQVRERIIQLIGVYELSKITGHNKYNPYDETVVSLDNCISSMSVRQCKEFLDVDIDNYIKPRWRNEMRTIPTNVSFVRLLACFKLISSHSLSFVFIALIESMSGNAVIQLLMPLFFEIYKQTWFNIKDNRDVYTCSYDYQNNKSEISPIYSHVHVDQPQDLDDLKKKVEGMKDEILDLIIGKPSN